MVVVVVVCGGGGGGGVADADVHAMRCINVFAKNAKHSLAFSVNARLLLFYFIFIRRGVSTSQHSVTHACMRCCWCDCNVYGRTLCVLANAYANIYAVDATQFLVVLNLDFEIPFACELAVFLISPLHVAKILLFFFFSLSFYLFIIARIRLLCVASLFWITYEKCDQGCACPYENLYQKTVVGLGFHIFCLLFL